MSDFDYVLAVIDPWINKFIDCGANALRFEEIVGVGVWLLEAEVNNGGFDQYYFNSAGDLASYGGCVTDYRCQSDSQFASCSEL